MRFIVFVKGNEASEKGVMPTSDELLEMGKFNEELVKAGVMLAGDGLQPTAKGAKIRFDAAGKATVVDGPFTEAKEIIAGYWIIDVRNKEEAVAWMSRAPFKSDEIELRQIFELSDFAPSEGLDKHLELVSQIPKDK